MRSLQRLSVTTCLFLLTLFVALSTATTVRAVGFDDKGILQITLIASWFNYINRVADALGVGRD